MTVNAPEAPAVAGFENPATSSDCAPAGVTCTAADELVMEVSRTVRVVGPAVLNVTGKPVALCLDR